MTMTDEIYNVDITTDIDDTESPSEDTAYNEGTLSAELSDNIGDGRSTDAQNNAEISIGGVESQDDDNIINIEHLGKNFGEHVVLKDIVFSGMHTGGCLLFHMMRCTQRFNMIPI